MTRTKGLGPLSALTLLCGVALPISAQTAPPATQPAAPPPVVAPAITAAQNAALEDHGALDFVEGLTTEVGPRLAGTEAEGRAREWAARYLRAAGFANVAIEEYQMPTWVRGEERATVIAPFAQNLTITALGNSGATPAAGMDGEIVGFHTLAEFDAAPDAVIRGKIVYISHAMRPAQDGSSYGPYGNVRRQAPDRASKRGAAAILIRSIGTDWHRNPHTGVTNFTAGTTPIPAAALSNPDADNLERMMARSATPVRIHLLLTPRQTGPQTSGNVIAEVPGSDPAAGVVLIACHLDSWDLGTGAIDDAAGCGIIQAAAQRVRAMGQPRRTIRILFAGAEEVGGFGAAAYATRHTADNHALVMESDFGAARVWSAAYSLPAAAAPLADRIALALNPLGATRSRNEAHGGTDVEPVAETGVAVIDLAQDGTDYFNLHHTPDDTFDKIEPRAIAQNVAAWVTTLALVANAPEALGKRQ